VAHVVDEHSVWNDAKGDGVGDAMRHEVFPVDVEKAISGRVASRRPLPAVARPINPAPELRNLFEGQLWDLFWSDYNQPFA
jgi:hypothetical protein